MTMAALATDPCVVRSLRELGGLVLAVQQRMEQPGVQLGFDPAQRAWPELQALVHSIEHDDGWALFAMDAHTPWQRLFLYLDAPQAFVRSANKALEIAPRQKVRWSHTALQAVEDAKIARAKRLGRDLPAYSDEILRDMRERQWFQWGRP